MVDRKMDLFLCFVYKVRVRIYGRFVWIIVFINLYFWEIWFGFWDVLFMFVEILVRY